MTSKAIFYYTETGKTEAALNKEVLRKIDLIKLNNRNYDEVDLDRYDYIFIGTPTYGRGVPPIYFKTLLPKLHRLSGKKIGLFGSGNTIYGDDFCGALDLLQEILEVKNEIIFKYKFEGFPRNKDIEILTKMILEA